MSALTLQQFVVRLNAIYDCEGTAPTLLGIGPMSEISLQASCELARDLDFPVILVASRNQIDADALGGGYVLDWNQRTFIADLQRIAKKVGFTGLLYPCRDHGGPWQRDEERGARLPEAEAMAKAKESFLEDLLAGYSLLHIDPTKDPHVSGQVAMEVVLRRTVELLEYVEGERVERKLPAISYEIGTEETAGGLIGDQAFEKFIVDLLAQLDAKGLPHPAFIVGQTGTLVKMDRNVGKFDADTAQRLAAIARRHGIGFKEHNGDYLPMDVLEAHPGLGLTATNVAPEFGLDETVALLQLADQEQRSGGPSSGFLPLIQERAIASGRWKKWLLPEDAGLTEEQILQSPEKIRLVTRVCGHYVFQEPAVVEARARLYANMQATGLVPDPERFVIDAVKASIEKYIRAFNSVGVTTLVSKA